MEIDRMEDSWVTRRLAALEPLDDWRPDPVRAWERFRSRRRARAARRRNTLLALAAGTITALVFADITPRACANPRGCEQPQPAADSHLPVKLTPAQFKA